jgi:hypothetical protein
MNHKSFLMRRPSSRKDRLFKWNEYVRYKIVAVRFDIIKESVDNIKANRVSYDYEYEFLLWILSLGFMTMSFLDRVHMRYGYVFKKDHDSSLVTRWCKLSCFAICKNGNIAFAYSFRFPRKSCVSICGTCQYFWKSVCLQVFKELYNQKEKEEEMAKIYLLNLKKKAMASVESRRRESTQWKFSNWTGG